MNIALLAQYFLLKFDLLYHTTQSAEHHIANLGDIKIHEKDLREAIKKSENLNFILFLNLGMRSLIKYEIERRKPRRGQDNYTTFLNNAKSSFITSLTLFYFYKEPTLFSKEIFFQLMTHFTSIYYPYNPQPAFVQSVVYSDPAVYLYSTIYEGRVNNRELQIHQVYDETLQKFIETTIKSSESQGLLTTRIEKLVEINNDRKKLQDKVTKENKSSTISSTEVSSNIENKTSSKDTADMPVQSDKETSEAMDLSLSLIVTSIRNGKVDLDAVKNYIEHTTNLNDPNSKDNLLLLAIQYHLNDLLDLLLKNPKVDYKQAEAEGPKPIHVAAELNNVYALERLIDAGVDINDRDNLQNTALHIAIKNHLVEATELLVKKGANVNARTQEGNAMYILINCARNSPTKDANVDARIASIILSGNIVLETGYRNNYTNISQYASAQGKFRIEEAIDTYKAVSMQKKSTLEAEVENLKKESLRQQVQIEKLQNELDQMKKTPPDNASNMTHQPNMFQPPSRKNL